MNVLRRAIAGEILPSSSSLPTKSSLFTRVHPQNHQTFPLQESCCLYSTATTTSPSKSKKKQVGTPKTTKTSKNHKENPPKLPRTWAEAARQLLVQPPEKAELQKGQAAGQAPVVPPEKAELQKGLNGEGYRKDLPRPSEIQWQKKAANSVNLIGRIQIPVQFEASQDGKYWAGTLISEANSGALGNSAFWIPIIFEGDLAHIAACHLKPTDYVHIAGELNSDPPPFALKEAQGSVQVMVHNINFVHESSQAKNTFTSENPEELDKFGTSSSVIETKSGGNTASKFPDLEHKRKHTADWSSYETPEWALALLNGSQVESTEIKSTTMPPNPTPKKESEGDNPWNNLVKNPNKWWDNRKKKVNPKGPDFVHKDTREALWLDGCPPSLRSSLPPSGSPLDVQLSNPTLKEEIKTTPMPPNPTPKKVASEGDTFWKDLVENPNKWWDNRKKKVNPKAPDFVHKDTREALWLNRCPPSLRSRLSPSGGSQVDAQLPNPTPKEEIKATAEGEESWKDLVENPNKWWDNRKGKVNPRAPDFKHKDTKVGLWVDRCPASLISRLPHPREKGWSINNI